MTAFKSIDQRISDMLRQAASVWSMSPNCHLPQAATIVHWDRILHAWIDIPEIPLLLRRSGSGKVIQHGRSGRDILFVDNSPAVWCYTAALLNRTPSFEELAADLRSHRLPVARIRTVNKGPYQGLLVKDKNLPSVNGLGFKVCHIERVGLNKKEEQLQRLPIDVLKKHCLLLLNPRNMFLVPKVYSGLGELPEFVAFFKERMDRLQSIVSRAHGPLQ